MAQHHVPFILARIIYEGNEADNKWNFKQKSNSVDFSSQANYTD
jgi:hypothetical protein